MNQRKKPYYSLEFKQDAAQLVLKQGYSISEAAKNLGVSVGALRTWVKAENGDNAVKNQLSLGEREELLRLRKEVNRLKMEREILKKAAVFFAQDHG